MTSPFTLYASVLRLVARNDARVPVSNGQYVQAAFLRLLQEVDPDLSQVLHDTKTRKAFTVSPLLGDLHIRDRLIHLRPGDECWLRFTLIGAELFKAFTRQFVLGNARPNLSLGSEGRAAMFEIAEVRTTTGSHPWAGAALADALVPAAGAARKVTLEFFTPTTFEDKGKADGDKRFQTVLLPEYVFGNLMHKWMVMGFDAVLDLTGAMRAPVPVGGAEAAHANGKHASPLSAWRDVFKREIAIAGMRNITTRAVLLHNQSFIGTTGCVTYEISGDDVLCRCVNLLADAAFFFGVGRKTTMGLGMCRRIAP